MIKHIKDCLFCVLILFIDFCNRVEAMYVPLSAEAAAEDASHLLRRINQLEAILESSGLKYLSLKSNAVNESPTERLQNLREESGIANAALQNLVRNSRNVKDQWSKSFGVQQ